MKGAAVIVLCALFSTSYAISDTDLVYWMANCSVRAASKGIEGFMPSHNPLWIKDFNYTTNVLGIEYYFELTNNFIYSLMDVEFKKVDVTTYTNPGKLLIDYDVYWPTFNFTGNYAWYAKALGVKIAGKNGTYNIVLKHTDFTGIFNLTKPGQEAKGIKEHLDEFTLKFAVKEVMANITGVESGSIINNLLESLLMVGLNNVPDSVGEFIKEERFGKLWIDKPQNIDKLIAWCVANPA